MLFWPLVGSAQQHDCGTVPSSNYAEYYKELRQDASRIDLGHYRTLEFKVPIQLHLVRNSDGTADYSYDDVVRDLQDANNYFEGAHITFYVSKSVNYIDDNRFYDFHVNEEKQLAPQNDISGALNIYVVDQIRKDEGFIAGYTYLPQQKIDRIFISQKSLRNGVTLAHELGHYLSLIHTHGMSGIDLELADGSNCSSGGDLMCDTPADPRLFGKVDNECNYIGNEVDAHGDPFTPDTRNIMAYSPSSCRDHFSEEQLAQMIHSLQTNRTNLVVGENFDILPDAPASSSTKELAINFDVYPNPTSGLVYMDLSNTLSEDIDYRIALMDMTGRIVKETTTDQNGGLAQVDFAGLEKGIYMVNVYGRNSMASHQILYQ